MTKSQKRDRGASSKGRTKRPRSNQTAVSKDTKTQSKTRAAVSPITFGDIDLHLFGEGKHERIYEKLGAHIVTRDGKSGVAFALWAPNANNVSVVGNFNGWNGNKHRMQALGGSGVWEIFIPGLSEGYLYKYEIHNGGRKLLKADPYGFMMQVPPDTSSVVFQSKYKFRDGAWVAGRQKRQAWREPMSIYEVHLGSWRRITEEGNRPLSYREIAPLLATHARENAFTHIEFLPLKEHPYGPSWGYQVSAYFAPSARYGTPDDFRFLVDHLHQKGIGVIMDWVPAHFPKDAFALARFDGTAIYEHADPRKGEHPDWGTYIFY
jgi:1,4-alpha-glucan branching enzyme